MPSPVIAARGRPPRVPPDRRLRRLVSAVFDLPYALEPVQRAYSGLTSSEWKHTRPQAARNKVKMLYGVSWLTRADHQNDENDILGPARPPLRTHLAEPWSSIASRGETAK